MENLYWPTLFFKSLLRNPPCITTPRQQNESCYSPAGRACRPQGSYLCRRSVNRPLSTAPIWLTGWSTALTAVTAISTIYYMLYTLCVVGRVEQSRSSRRDRLEARPDQSSACPRWLTQPRYIIFAKLARCVGGVEMAGWGETCLVIASCCVTSQIGDQSGNKPPRFNLQNCKITSVDLSESAWLTFVNTNL